MALAILFAAFSDGSSRQQPWEATQRGWQFDLHSPAVVTPIKHPSSAVASPPRQSIPRVGDSPTTRRRPRHLILSHAGRWLWVGCSNGDLLQINTRSLRTVGQYEVARSCSDLQFDEASGMLYGLDERHSLLWGLRLPDSCDDSLRLDLQENLFTVPLPVPPRRLTIHSPHHLAITSAWKQELLFLQREGSSTSWQRPQVTRIPLPFTPEDAVYLGTQHGSPRWLITDAFGGEIGILDATSGELLARLVTDGHNYRGAILSKRAGASTDGSSEQAANRADQAGATEVLLTFQRGDPFVPLTATAIEFGDAMQHFVGKLTFDERHSSDRQLTDMTRYELGFTGRAAADPRGIQKLGDEWLIPLSGVHQVARVHPKSNDETRIPVGRHPVDLVITSTARAFVASAFDEQIDVIDLRTNRVIRSIKVGTNKPRSAIDRGEELFFDATLSRDNWMSCHSCHVDGHTNGGLADTRGDQSYGTPKRVLTLHGVSRTDPWAWNGTVKELAEQIDRSVKSTMHGTQLTALEIYEMQQYLASLPAPPAAWQPETSAEQQLHQQGQRLFRSLGCADCHVPPLTLTTNGRFDVGLVDEAGERRFNPPSLRGVGLLPRLFHNGSAKSLEEVIGLYEHQLPRVLDAEEQAALIAYLRSL